MILTALLKDKNGVVDIYCNQDKDLTKLILTILKMKEWFYRQGKEPIPKSQNRCINEMQYRADRSHTIKKKGKSERIMQTDALFDNEAEIARLRRVIDDNERHIAKLEHSLDVQIKLNIELLNRYGVKGMSKTFNKANS